MALTWRPASPHARRAQWRPLSRWRGPCRQPNQAYGSHDGYSSTCWLKAMLRSELFILLFLPIVHDAHARDSRTSFLYAAEVFRTSAVLLQRDSREIFRVGSITMVVVLYTAATACADGFLLISDHCIGCRAAGVCASAIFCNYIRRC